MRSDTRSSGASSGRFTLPERFREWWWRFRCPTEFLCDNCRYDHPSACSHPERPNAVKCPDYKPK